MVADVANGKVSTPLITTEAATKLLGTMLGGYNVQPLIALLDNEEVDLKPFDVVVQRGTNHAWVNNGDEPALLIAVLIDSNIK